jgi:nucleotide-binding universal stress UspA family protein
MLERILAPLDDSDHARGVLPLACALAAGAHAQLTLLQVVPDLTVHAHAEAVFNLVADELQPTGLTLKREIVDGDPVSGIVSVAKAHSVDLICMTTERWSDVDRWLNGSVMDAVLRRSGVPVLVVPPVCKTVSGRVLVALDGSPLAEEVLPIATDVAAALGARVCLMRVDDDINAARDYLLGVKSRLPDSTSVQVAVGGPAQAIVAIAHAAPTSLIAMATHGRTGLARLALGSVATRVLQGAGMPMLLVRPLLSKAQPFEETQLSGEADPVSPVLVAPWFGG